MKKIAEVAWDITTCLRNDDINGLAKIAGQILDDDSGEVEKFVASILPELRKEAGSAVDDYYSNKENDSKTLGSLAALGLSLIPVAYFAHKHYKDKGVSNKVLDKILRDPVLGSDPAQTKRFFAKIQKYAPALADDEDVTKNLLKEWHRMGGKSIQPEMIEKLLKVQKTHTESSLSRSPVALGMAAAIGSGGLMKAIPKLIESATSPKKRTMSDSLSKKMTWV